MKGMSLFIGNCGFLKMRMKDATENKQDELESVGFDKTCRDDGE